MGHNNSDPRIAYLTAGAAGMICGSCLRDNALAAALHRTGVDIQLIPTYTPIVTDEQNVSTDQVFFGGINVYLQQKIPAFRYVPAALDRLLDRPGLIRWVSRRGMQTSAKNLGALTVSMLRGTTGFQRKEVARLCRWLSDSLRPDLVNFSNILIAGCSPELKRRLPVPVLVTLQGDDFFLEGLPAPYREQALAEARKLVSHVDAFIVFSAFYAEHMAAMLNIPDDKIRVVPLGINTADLVSTSLPDDGALGANTPVQQAADPPGAARHTVGYLARLAPEKGLHVLVDAIVHMWDKPDLAKPRLLIAGWLGSEHRSYAEQQFAKLEQAGLSQSFDYLGTVDRAQKLDFFRRIDLLSVPTTYQEPKGLFVLEAMAAGVPVVQPDHGAFPELIRNTGGGRLSRPGDHKDLAAHLSAVLLDDSLRQQLGCAGRLGVQKNHSVELMAGETMRIYREFLK